MGGGPAPSKFTKTVVVLGAAYGGARAAQILAAGVPNGWRVILIDRNSHANHVYVMPRFAVLPGHEFKAFIPYTNVFLLGPDSSKPHINIQAHVTSIRPTHITLSKAFPEHGIPSTTLSFDYAIYALGSHLPSPLNLWGARPDQSDVKSRPSDEDIKINTYGGTKPEGVEWMKKKQALIEKSDTVLIVGGGALGIQFATDIRAVYPGKKITLLHSCQRLLPRFDEQMHTDILTYMESAEIDLILGERLDLSSLENGQAKTNAEGKRVVRTEKGREIAADLLLLCTGQTPNTSMLKAMDPTTVGENNLIRVFRSMQIGVVTDGKKLEEKVKQLNLESAPAAEGNEKTKEGKEEELKEEETPYPHIFAIGDAADAFGAIPAGHCAYIQGEVAARNVIRLIKKAEGSTDEELEKYTPGQPAIKVSLGLRKAIYQLGGQIGSTTDCKDDLQAPAIWPYFGIKVEKEEDMYP